MNLKINFLFAAALLLAISLGALLGGYGVWFYLNQERNNDAHLMRIRAGLAYDQGLTKLSLGLAHQAAALDKRDYFPYFLMGRIYQSGGSLGMAKISYEKSFDLLEKEESNGKLSKGRSHDKGKILELLESISNIEATAE